MARSHHRPKKHHPQQHHAGSFNNPRRKRAAPVISILIGSFGFVIAYFAAGPDIIALIAGALIGAVAGYFIGNSIDKTALKK